MAQKCDVHVVFVQMLLSKNRSPAISWTDGLSSSFGCVLQWGKNILAQKVCGLQKLLQQRVDVGEGGVISLFTGTVLTLNPLCPAV